MKLLANYLSTYVKLTRQADDHGLQFYSYKLLPSYGRGVLEYYRLDGLTIILTDVQLKQDISDHLQSPEDTLVLSYLVDGERIIKLANHKQDLVYEGQESYMIYLDKFSGLVRHSERRAVKELKIVMNRDFIQKHGLDGQFSVATEYGIKNLEKHFAKPFCSRSGELLAEIFMDKSEGIHKRLFLESKVLELLRLKIAQGMRRSEEYTAKKPMLKQIYQIKKIISADLKASYTIPQLARISGLNEFVVKKEFKRVFGKSLSSYTLDLKMTQAKRMLKSTNQNICEIADQVGYKNATHFSAAFKRMEGVTPNNFRSRPL